MNKGRFLDFLRGRRGIPVTGPAPSCLTAPTISGPGTPGVALTVSDGIWPVGTTLARQWVANTADISGAIGTSYTPLDADRGKDVWCKTTGTYNGASSSPVPSNAIRIPLSGPVGAPVCSVSPVVSGVPQANNILSSSDGTWIPAVGAGGTSLSKQWYKDGVATGVFGPTIPTTNADIGSTFDTRTIGTAADISSNPVPSSNSIGPIVAQPPNPGPAPTVTTPPSASGSATRGQTLTANSGVYVPAIGSGTSVQIQWKRGVSLIEAFGPTYVTQVADEGFQMGFQEVATNNGLSTTTQSSNTIGPIVAPAPGPAPTNSNAPTVSGSTEKGNTITFGDGVWNPSVAAGTTLTKQALRNGAAMVPPVFGNSYVTTDADVGATISSSTVGTFNGLSSAPVVSSNSVGPITEPPVGGDWTGAAAATVPLYETMCITVTGSAPTTTDGCRLEYKKSSESVWKVALPLWYDPRFNGGEYRGMVFRLTAGTLYNFRAINDAGKILQFNKATRVDVHNLPIDPAKTNVMASRTASTLVVTSGGTASGYALYKGVAGEDSKGRPLTVFNANKAVANCVEVNDGVGFVIFSRIRFTGALENCVRLGPSGVDKVASWTDIIFDRCWFDEWGSARAPDAFGTFGKDDQAGIYSQSNGGRNLTVQGCRFTNPTWTSNAWSEGGHPTGPQCIVLYNSKGGHVWRWNDMRVDKVVDGTNVRWGWNDAIGDDDNFVGNPPPSASFGGANGGTCYGYTNIHNNYIAHSWDDSIEIEGTVLQLGFFHNFIDQTYTGLGLAGVHRGPLYVFDNIWRHCRKGTPQNGVLNDGGINLIKIRRTGNPPGDSGGGRVFLCNNTTLPAVGTNPITGTPWSSYNGLINEDVDPADYVTQFIVLNNSVHQSQEGVNTSKGAIKIKNGDGNLVDYNLVQVAREFQSTPTISFPQRRLAGMGTEGGVQQANGLGGLTSSPLNWSHESGWGMNETTLQGNFRHATGSPGKALGISIANLCDAYGARPDAGAHQGADAATWKVGPINMPNPPTW